MPSARPVARERRRSIRELCRITPARQKTGYDVGMDQRPRKSRAAAMRIGGGVLRKPSPAAPSPWAVMLRVHAGTLQDGPPRPRALKLRNDESADQFVGADRPPRRCSLALPTVGRKRGRIPAASAFLGLQLGVGCAFRPIDLNGIRVRTSFARVRARVLVSKLRTGLRTAR